jgi:hypothetical protein
VKHAPIEMFERRCLSVTLVNQQQCRSITWHERNAQVRSVPDKYELQLRPEPCAGHSMQVATRWGRWLVESNGLDDDLAAAWLTLIRSLFQNMLLKQRMLCYESKSTVICLGWRADCWPALPDQLPSLPCSWPVLTQYRNACIFTSRLERSHLW